MDVFMSYSYWQQVGVLLLTFYWIGLVFTYGQLGPFIHQRPSDCDKIFLTILLWPFVSVYWRFIAKDDKETS